MLLALILIFFVGKAFYELAERYNRSRWGFAVVGVATYYAGIFASWFVMGIFSELGIVAFSDFPEAVLGIMAFPFGVLSCWGTYSFLKKQWGKPKKVDTMDILDHDLMK